MKIISEKGNRKIALLFTIIFMVLLVLSSTVYAEPNNLSFPNIDIRIGNSEDAQEGAQGMQIIFLLTILSLAPSILIMMTGFTRIVIVLSFIRNALGIQQLPPNQVLVGLALFLTFFVMTPVFDEVNETAYQPLVRNEISQQIAIENAMKPMRTFMLKQTYNKDLSLFMSLANEPGPENIENIKNTVIIPAFITSELKRAFQIGFFIFIPFIVIDMVVSSTLMTMGMMMLPPMMISLPFKILLFIMVDGWNLVIKTLITGFN